MTWSEFGRRVKENAQQGTDHGSAGLLFVMGGQVKGGFYGEPVSLNNLDDGNLRFTTDFRSVYATVLESWLGASSEACWASASTARLPSHLSSLLSKGLEGPRPRIERHVSYPHARC